MIVKLKMDKMFSLSNFKHKDTFLSRMDIKLKLSILLMLIAAVSITLSSLFLCGIFIFIISVSRCSEIPFFLLAARLRPFLWFFLFSLIMHSFFTPGKSIPYFPLFGINITYDGIYQGIFIVFKVSILILSTFIFVSTTSSEKLIQAVNGISRPFQYIFPQTKDISNMIMLTMRFIPLLLSHAEIHIRREKIKIIEKKGVFNKIVCLAEIVDSYFESVIQYAPCMIDDVLTD